MNPYLLEHDIEADWTLYLTCNYTCNYCFYTPEQLRSKLTLAASNEKWQQAFDATGLRWLIHLTGGEPSVHPEFADLCRRLTQKHSVSINSNLTQGSWIELAETVDPSRVKLINAGFHPMERLARKGDEAYIKHFTLLRSKGFRLLPTVVATPEVLGQYDEICARLKADDIVPVPKLLRGKYQGRTYPADYTDHERALFTAALTQARVHYGPLLDALAEPLTINPFVDDQYLHALPDFIGHTCGAGRTFVQVSPTGRVQKCPNEYMGNLLEGSFVRAKADILCTSRYCHYWCLRHVNLAEDSQRIEERRSLLYAIDATGSEVRELETRIKTLRADASTKVQRLQSLLVQK